MAQRGKRRAKDARQNLIDRGHEQNGGCKARVKVKVAAARRREILAENVFQ